MKSSTSPEEPLPGLGEKVVPVKEERSPKLIPIRQGSNVYRNESTGKIETRIPGNEAAKCSPAVDWYREHGFY